MEFDAHGFSFKLSTSEEKVVGGEIKRTRHLEIWFMGVDCNSLQLLAYIKSWIQSYLYGKIGALKTNDTLEGDWQEKYISFSKSQLDGEVFLRVEVLRDDQVYERSDLDYQQVAMIDVALNKCLNLVEV